MMATTNGRDTTANLNDEEQPLLGGSQPSSSGWRKRLNANVHRDWADIILLLCYVITGVLDSASISTWGSFVSMQTGNTVYIGLGIASPAESKRWIKSGISLISFCVGSFFFSRFHRHFTPSRRWVLCMSFTVQMAFIIVAASIVTWVPRSENELHWSVLVPIALVAFQSCGQAVTSRALKYNALTSVVLTSIYCDLFSDAELFAQYNIERNRRAAAPVLLMIGAVLGGVLARSSLGAEGALWIAAGMKLLVVVSWYLWREEDE
ncbi:hypothetical protein BJ878DRAFT_79994 [Calycina marina]|uniref:DUF1275 domain protein n=1 Tax=Calycina marina TaxID=1763456 RepID=A0A9P7Z2A0_9HELO|nr:hypothetical protein BJ878DRAFT_79994 [Calycina marina]